MRLLEFLQDNAAILVDYARAWPAGRRIATAPAESVINHLINRRAVILKARQFMEPACGVGPEIAPELIGEDPSDIARLANDCSGAGVERSNSVTLESA